MLQSKVPLPADALVAAHVPWTETTWEEYPSGVPIKNQEITDAFSQFYPWRSFVGKSWRSKSVPLWNPYMFSGAPFLATWHSAVLYPLNFVYLLFDDITSWTILVFLQIFLSGVFMYLFLKRLNLNSTASVFGGLTFAFSGYMIAWLEFATGGHAGLWLPLLLLLELELTKTRKTIWIIPISFVFFFVYTAGDFQIPFYETVTYIIFGFYLCLKDGNKKLVNLLNMFLALVVGILLSLPQILPSLEFFTSSIRFDDSYIREYYFGIMHWEKVVNFLWPDFFGNVVTRNYWGKFGYHEYLAFVGSITLVLVVFSFLQKKLKYEIFFWSLLLLSLIFLFPTPLAFLPFKLKFPGLGTSSASRIIFLVDFCLVIIASYGFEKLFSSNFIKNLRMLLKTVFYFLTISFGVFSGIVFALIKMNYWENKELQTVVNLRVSLKNIIPSTLVLFCLFCIFATLLFFIRLKFKKNLVFGVGLKNLLMVLVLCLSVIEMLRFAWKNTPFSPRKFVFPETQITSFLQSKNEFYRIAGGIPLNLFMQYELSSVEGYDSIYPRENSEWFSLVNSQSLSSLSGRYGLIHKFDSPLLDYANVKYVVDYKKDPFGGISELGMFAYGIAEPRYKEVFSEGRIKVFENTNVLPRVWISNSYKVVPSEGLVKEVLSLNTSDKVIILEDYIGNIEAGQEKYLISNFSYFPNRIKIGLETEKDSLLFLSESYNPNWRVFIDGMEGKIFRANYLYQSVRVPKGVHMLEFIYDPKSFKIGKLVSICTVFLIVIYSSFLRNRAS